jgi:hypothetical protein
MTRAERGLDVGSTPSVADSHPAAASIVVKRHALTSGQSRVHLSSLPQPGRELLWSDFGGHYRLLAVVFLVGAVFLVGLRASTTPWRAALDREAVEASISGRKMVSASRCKEALMSAGWGLFWSHHRSDPSPLVLAVRVDLDWVGCRDVRGPALLLAPLPFGVLPGAERVGDGAAERAGVRSRTCPERRSFRLLATGWRPEGAMACLRSGCFLAGGIDISISTWYLQRTTPALAGHDHVEVGD